MWFLNEIRKSILSALFFSLGLILPFLTGQIQHFGNMLLPMHIPVMLCGLICGPFYGAVSGFLLPIVRSLIFTMPVMYPNALAMAFELATYGIVIGIIYRIQKIKSIKSVYISLIISMICGRVIWALAQIVLLGIKDCSFTFETFLMTGFINSIPGIVLQLILIPALMSAVNKSSYFKYDKHRL